MSEIGDDDKRQFFKDGFLIVRNAVSSELVARAKALIEEAIPEDERHLLVPGKLATHDDVTGLFNNSTLADIIERLMGPFPPVISCQVAVTPPFNLLGGKPGTHVAGMASYRSRQRKSTWRLVGQRMRQNTLVRTMRSEGQTMAFFG